MNSNVTSKLTRSIIVPVLFLLTLGGCGILDDSPGIETLEPTLLSLKAEARYLNFPVTDSDPEVRLKVSAGGEVIDEFDIHLAQAEPDYYVFLDLAPYQGELVHVDIPALPKDSNGPNLISVSDQITGAENLYREPLRQQVHFSSRRGWNNDPNGLVYLDGEYHLYYQHNPYGWPWGNMHWGHAVSSDLVHWEELPIAIYPKTYGDWAFSGSAVIDTENLSGFQSGENPVLVAAYTSTGRGEVIAFSNDRGRTFTEYGGNPVIEHQGRDPKVIWFEPGKHWVAAVYHEEDEKQWIAFYTSPDLKTWSFESKIEGFYECPELFEIEIQETGESKWVLYGADGAYMIGSFDGREFISETGKIPFHHGNIFYASQTFNNIPDEDGRRIQIAWGRTDSPGMPFNQCMLFPVALSLKKTEGGLRLTPSPVREIEKLHLDPLNIPAQRLDPGYYNSPRFLGQTLHLRAAWDQGKENEVIVTIAGFPLKIDTGGDSVSFGEHSAPLPDSGGEIELNLIVDRLSLEVFVNQGEVYMPLYLDPKTRTAEYSMSVEGKAIELKTLTVWPLASIWEKGKGPGAGPALR